jgi:calcium-dependent protein kinase
MDGAAGPLGKGSFGDVLLGWSLLPRAPDESVVLWQKRCREGPQLAIKRIRPLPAVVSTKLVNALAPVQGVLRAKSKFLAVSKRSAGGGGGGAAAAAAAAATAATATATAAAATAKLAFNSSRVRIRDRAAVRREAAILALLSEGGGSPHVIRLLDAVEDERFVYIAMELVAGGDLMKFVAHARGWGERGVAAVFKQLLTGLAHCHARDVVHRDLKPDNFLVASLSASPPHVCIADFGLATRLSEGEVLSDVVGSAYFIAPEVLTRRYGKACDVWSLGVNLYLLLSGKVPFGGAATRSAEVLHCTASDALEFPAAEWSAVSPLAKDLVAGLLEKDPARRYTVADALAHPWVTGTQGHPEAPLGTDIVRSMLAFTSINRLRAQALHAVANSLTAAEAAKLRTQFFHMDLNGDAGISPSELSAALAGLGLQLAASELAKLVAALDVDGDGRVDAAEFLAATSELALLQHKGSAMRAFARFDTNGDGLIDFEEARAVLADADRRREEAGCAAESDGGEDEQLRELMTKYGKERGSESTLNFGDFWDMLYPGVPMLKDEGEEKL